MRPNVTHLCEKCYKKCYKPNYNTVGRQGVMFGDITSYCSQKIRIVIQISKDICILAKRVVTQVFTPFCNCKTVL